MATHGKTKTHALHYWWNKTYFSSFYMLEQGCHVYYFWLWQRTKFEYWLALPNIFWQVGWHSWNVPLEYMGCNLQHRCGMYRNMLYKFQQLLYTCSFFLVIRNKIGMVHFARLMWIALGNGGEVSYSSVELNNFESSKSQSLMLWSLGPDKTSWPPLVDLDLYTWSLNHSHYHDL